MEYLMHYGIKRRSGRYPYGSGEDPYQHENWINTVKDLRKSGLTDTEIAKSFGMSTKEFRERNSINSKEKRAADSARAYQLKQKGYSNTEIGRIMGKNESSIRSLLDPHLKVKNDIIKNTTDVLKRHIDKDNYIDVGKGSEYFLGISRQKLNASIRALEDEGYKKHYIQVNQPFSYGKKVSMMVLTPPGTERSEVNKNRDRIHLLEEHSNDKGLTYLGIKPPVNISSKRIKINYAEDGGKDKDGTIEIRRGVEDLSLGKSSYAQVRIAVDGTHFLKGMAVYSDGLPKGVDIVFNTNKKRGTPMMGSDKDNTVLKKMKNDPDNPFGTVLKMKGGQYEYVDKHGNKKLSAINKVNEEGDWGEWKKTIASQVLSKQSRDLIRDQLDLTYKDKLSQFDKIKSIKNPILREKMLMDFGDDCDTAAIHLKAIGFSRQKSHVILPLNSLSDKEVYAPGYKDGERVVLVRYPHGGIFELPNLKVNNKNKEGRKIIGTSAKDAIGINSKVAEMLSGADFDGDTVLVIPNNSGKIRTSKQLEGLKNFDPKESYPKYEGMKIIKPQTVQIEMGKISNLITDMTLKDANEDELARAVRHSMVIIDSYKHELNYKQSYIDNGIAELKTKYQGKSNAGASTLISRAKSVERIPEIDYNRPIIDKKTGEKTYLKTGRTYIDKKGKVQEAITEVPAMSTKKNAFDLSSGNPKETLYANYANSMKSLANKSRKASLSIKEYEERPEAKEIYKKEIESINKKLIEAKKNSPYERKALLIADAQIKMRLSDNPDMTKEEIKKIKTMAMAGARAIVKDENYSPNIKLTKKEWEALDAGAFSKSKAKEIISRSDMDLVKEYAIPKNTNTLSKNDVNRLKAMVKYGYTQEEIANALGISTSTVIKYY